jgi:hypothetical protein
MTGHSGVQYDDDRQTAAAPKVVETWDAVDGSRSGAEALRTAQMSSVWGHEDGPVAMRTRATDMFDTISELLAAERDLIQEFEVYMHQAMKEFTGTEYANETELKKIMSASLNSFVQKSSSLAHIQRIYARMGVKASTADIAKGMFDGVMKKAVTGAAVGAAAGVLGGVPGAVVATAQHTASVVKDALSTSAH